MENFFTNECHKCGGIDEAKFVIAGPHVKQVCLHCGFYVKFFDKSQIPSATEIRLKIWGITGGNLEIIEDAKKKCDFTPLPNQNGLLAKLLWWKVYLTARSLIPSNE